MPAPNSHSSQPLTEAELLALPAAVPILLANRALGFGRTKGYELAQRGQYPCRLLRHGRRYRVVKADLLNVLGIGGAAATDEADQRRAS